MSHKIAIGTVQFGLNYGINNDSGKVSFDESRKILELAKENNIDTLDTAYLYGESEKVLAELIKNVAHEWKVVSKFPEFPAEESLQTYFDKSCANLGLMELYAYLAHRPQQLIENPSIWNELKKLKDENRVQKIGYSLNTTQELEKLLELGMYPDLIQCPYNILDRRFEPYFEELNNMGCEIHTRSAYLQGLLFSNTEQLNSYFNPIAEIITKLQNRYTSELGAVLLQFCSRHEYIDKVVVGNDNSTQFKENIQSLNATLDPNEYKWIQELISSFEFSQEICIPMNWPKNG